MSRSLSALPLPEAAADFAYDLTINFLLSGSQKALSVLCDQRRDGWEAYAHLGKRPQGDREAFTAILC